MERPFYELTDEDKKYIVELIAKCVELGLGNINFQYFTTKENLKEYKFYMNEMNGFWRVVVKSQSEKDVFTFSKLDEYKIIDGNIEYVYSESD